MQKVSVYNMILVSFHGKQNALVFLCKIKMNCCVLDLTDNSVDKLASVFFDMLAMTCGNTYDVIVMTVLFTHPNLELFSDKIRHEISKLISFDHRSDHRTLLLIITESNNISQSHFYL